MAEIVKPDMTALWASGGAVVAPSRNKINEGWTAEIPPHQWENFVQLRQDEAIAYLYQRGIAEWDNTTEYFANKSVVLYNGSLYIAIVNNQNVNPANTTRWKPITGNATTSTAGLMSQEDKLKLDGMEAGAQKNVVLSVAGKVGAVSLSKSDVGLSNVDNTTDAQKPLSNAAINALNTKAPINSPTFTGTVSGVTKSMVGLGNVDNTSDLSKPISTATQTALNSKANTHNPTFTGTVSGITKGMVGLGNVDNTSDLNKPISTATQAAISDINTSLNTKANTSTQIIAGTGLTGGGTLSSNRTLNVTYGTTSGTAAEGNDSRITGAMQKSANLGDVDNVATARNNLGLGSAATRDVVISNIDTSGGNKLVTQRWVDLVIDGYALGMGQTWQDMTVNRWLHTEYTNTTGRPIVVSVSIHSVSEWSELEVWVDGVRVGNYLQGEDTSAQLTAVVPVGSAYGVYPHEEGTFNLLTWAELR